MALTNDTHLLEDHELRQLYEGMTLEPTSREPKNAGQPVRSVMNNLLAFATGGEILGVVEMKATAVKA